ncbi:MAG TPA: 4-hydroxy-tetrahydrodipicolinate synthase [Verrucomicrobiales bacterium]|nr:4-hydroxy-tetrahydrodipicolinate synthase [Verrucomicrobiales bacterium]
MPSSPPSEHFAGVHTAVITPFRDGEFDAAAFRSLIDRQCQAGIAGIVPVGTTGESPTLTHQEHARVIETAVQHTAGRALVIAGTGSNSTSEAVSLTKAAERAGADAALLVAPYYNKPSQQGLFLHFQAIAEATALPLILYSIPGRCGIEIGVETVVRLASASPTIAGIKEAGGTPERISQFRDVLPEGFAILSGDDSLTLPFLSVGACGVVSVAANLIPQVMADLVRLALTGDWDGARALHARYYPVFRALLQLDTNPVPIKTAMELAGLANAELRLPLAPIAPEGRDQLFRVLRDLDLLS